MISSFGVSVDVGQLERSIDGTKEGFKAVTETIKRSGMGQVITSKRKKPRAMKMPAKRFLHGQAIANILRKKGKDPFKYDPVVYKEVTDIVEGETKEIIEDAWKSKRPQTQRTKVLLRAAAQELADWAQDNIKKGGLGKKKKGRVKEASFKRRFQRLAARGIVPKEYGLPPPYGIFTGEFVKGIRATWKLGRVK